MGFASAAGDCKDGPEVSCYGRACRQHCEKRDVDIEVAKIMMKEVQPVTGVQALGLP